MILKLWLKTGEKSRTTLTHDQGGYANIKMIQTTDLRMDGKVRGHLHPHISPTKLLCSEEIIPVTHALSFNWTDSLGKCGLKIDLIFWSWQNKNRDSTISSNLCVCSSMLILRQVLLSVAGPEPVLVQNWQEEGFTSDRSKTVCLRTTLTTFISSISKECCSFYKDFCHFNFSGKSRLMRARDSARSEPCSLGGFLTWTEPWGSQEARSCRHSLDSSWWRCQQMGKDSPPLPWS